MGNGQSKTGFYPPFYDRSESRTGGGDLYNINSTTPYLTLVLNGTFEVKYATTNSLNSGGWITNKKQRIKKIFYGL